MASLRRSAVLLLAILLPAACGQSPAAAPSSQPNTGPLPGAAPARLLVVTHTAGFRHDSLPAAEQALSQIGSDSGLFATEFCRTGDDVRTRLTAAGLAGIDAVFFANTSGNLAVPDLQAFLDWIGSGKGFLGTHSASDTYRDAPAYLEMLGGELITHGSIVEAEVRVSESGNPTVAHLAPAFRIADEWYRFRSIGAKTVLLKFDRNPPDGLGAAGDAVDLPLAWQKNHGLGRVFYTALGHRSEVWDDPRFRKHLLEAVRWAVRR